MPADGGRRQTRLSRNVLALEDVLGKLCREWKSRAFAAPGPDQEGATTLGKQFFEFHYCVGEWFLFKRRKIVGDCHAVASCTEPSLALASNLPAINCVAQRCRVTVMFDRRTSMHEKGLDESPDQRRNGSTGRTLTVSSSKARMAHNRRLTFIRRGLIVALRGVSCRYDSAQSR